MSGPLEVYLGNRRINNGDYVNVRDLSKRLKLYWSDSREPRSLVLENDDTNMLHYAIDEVTTPGTGEVTTWEPLTEAGTYRIRLLDINTNKEYRMIFHVASKPSDRILKKGGNKYCACIVEVAAKQSNECLKSKRWGDIIDGQRCYNPFPICNSRLKQPDESCEEQLNLDDFTGPELVAYALAHDKELPSYLEDRNNLTETDEEELREIILKGE